MNKNNTLQKIRESNKRKDLLFVGMEQESVKMPLELSESEQKMYKNFIQPNAQKVLESIDKVNKKHSKVMSMLAE